MPDQPSLVSREEPIQTVKIRPTKAQAAKLASHAVHHGNCDLDSWNKRLTRCQCGLFQLLTTLGYSDIDGG